MQCEICGRRADVHLAEIRDGKKTDRHFCQHCAARAAGLPINTGIVEIPRRFVEKHQKPPEGPAR